MYTTEGLVLKKIDSGEHDAVLIIYTKDFGKIRFYAQGVKKEEAKLRGHLEPMNLNVVSFVMSKKGERLTQAIAQKTWPNIRNSEDKMKAFWKIRELVDRYCLEGEKDESLWNVLTRALEYLGDVDFSPSEINGFMRSFESEFMSCLGYEGEEDARMLNFPA